MDCKITLWNCSNFTHFLKLKLSVPTVVQLSYVTPGPCPSTNVSHGLNGSNPTKLTHPQEHWTLSWAPFHHDYSKGKLGSKSHWQLVPPDPEPLTSWYWWLYKSWQLLKIYSYVEFKQAFTQSFTTWLALGGLCSSCTCQLRKEIWPRVLLTWVGSSPRTISKLVQIPSFLHGFLYLALDLNCQDIWWGELPSPSLLIHCVHQSNPGNKCMEMWA